MGLGSRSSRITEVGKAERLSGWRFKKIAGDSRGQYLHVQPCHLAETIALVCVLQLADYRIASGAQETANQTSFMIVVDG